MASNRKRAPQLSTPAFPRTLSIKQAAAYLSCTVWFLRTLIWNRRIPFIRMGHSYVFDVDDLNRFIENNKIGVSA